MAKETHPEFAITGVAIPGIQGAAGTIPKAPPPKSGFLHNVAIGTCEKAKTGPTGQGLHVDGHAAGVKPGGPTGDPLDAWKIGEDAADDKEGLDMQLIAGVEPAHDVAGGSCEAGVQGVVDAFIGLADPPRNLFLVFADDIGGAVGRGSIYDEVLQVGVALIDDGANRVLNITRSVVYGGHHGDARPRGGAHAVL